MMDRMKLPNLHRIKRILTKGLIMITDVLDYLIENYFNYRGRIPAAIYVGQLQYNQLAATPYLTKERMEQEQYKGIPLFLHENRISYIELVAAHYNMRMLLPAQYRKQS
jgi:hypothetical protein